MVAWLKALLFVVGGVTAAAGTAYVTGLLDPWIGPGPAVIAALPEGGPVDKEAVPEGEAASGGPVADEPTTSGDPATTEKQGRLVAPSFDVVRVEPDGSLLIAGNAAAGATVEVLTGDTVLGSATAGDAGDFVVVLDDPLEPGDYQIALRATSGGTAAMSMQTALVSVPETPDGEVLALVEEPGAPSRLITVPEGEAAPTDEAATTPPGDAPDGETTTGEQVAVAEDRSAAADDEAATQPEAAGNGEGVVADAQPEAEQEVAAASPDDASAPQQDDAASADASGEAPDTASGMAATNQPTTDAPAGEPEGQPSEQEIAALPTDEPADDAGDQPAQTPRVVVEAVEIEGDTVFVAGYADPGSTVRVYANEMHLGDARASEGGRFLIEARRELAVGDYVIRADVLAPDGSVLARAAVPFEREPGEAIAAVAVPQPGVEAEEPQTGGEAAPDAEAGGEVAADAPDAPDDGGAQAGTGTSQDNAAASGASPDATPGGAATDAETGPAVADAPSAEDKQADIAAAGSQDASDVADAASQDEPADANDAHVAGPPSSPGDAAAGSDAATVPPAGTQDETEIAAAPDATEPGGTELTAPKLQRVDSAVIIRRGDTLWRISRRVYGRGIRYSTIYLANQDQIEDPDRIWPGQVFSVPQETAEGETADMEAIGEQAVPADTESRIIR